MPQSVSQALASACHDGELLLFTGAGVSARAGGKTWTGILLSLADWAETYEPDLANLMRSRVKAGQLLQAATLFRRVLNAPEGEKSTALTDLFALKHYDWRSLMSLASLPIAGIVSTNYDASLLEAWKQILVQRDQETPHEIDKSHTNNAAWVKDPFYLFLHGRGQLALHAAEMVFDERDYERTYNDPAFTDGLLNLLSHRRLAFLGFSFTDPAILAILKSWRELRGTAFPQTPVAFISSDDTPLGFELARLNFKCIEYPSARHHEALWSAIAEVSKNLGSRPAADVSSARPFSVTFDAVRQLLGLCYAAAKMGSRVAPLRDVVLEGIVIALLEDAGKVGLARDVLTLEVGRRLGMPDVEVAPRLEIALGRLTSVGACKEDGLNLVSTHTVKNDLSEQTLQLARGVGKRMEVRESVALAPAETREISEVLVELFVVRAWDLAASFVSPVVGEIGSAASTLSSLVGRSKLSAPKREAAEHAIADLLNRPSRAEASILAELGRLGFALQIALGHARTTFSHGMTLPQRMYLDASVLMPAIVRGHPLASLYGPTIDRLRDQVKRMAGQIRIIAPEEFLNEIVSHRARAIEEVRALQLEDRDRLEREVRFRGTDGLNVFVAAYASLSAEFSGKGSFHKFLLAIAPYQTERALATYLRDLGFEVERLDSVAWRRSNDIGFIKSELEAGYAKDGRREKVG
ncbi:MAG: SIR2 family protein, partial [bacterium]